MQAGMISRYALSRRRNRLFQTLFRWTIGRLPANRGHAPDIADIGDYRQVIREHLASELALHGSGPKPRFLDIGARQGECSVYADGFDYAAIDIEPRAAHVLVGDICNCPQIESASFDVVFSMDVLEHVERPWDAAGECVRLLRPGGLMIHKTLFSYRYHPSPIDYWRFSAQGLAYLFTRTGVMTTLVAGYDIRGRRNDMRGESLRSKPPIDYLGGFRENWLVLYIGRKQMTAVSPADPDSPDRRRAAAGPQA
jgi:SAM-dependent methyltransferase